MNDEMIVKAIHRLKPTAQFTFNNCDYSTIKWDLLEGDAPTLKDIENAIKANAADEINQAKETASAKAQLLERLGITPDEAKLLLS